MPDSESRYTVSVTVSRNAENDAIQGTVMTLLSYPDLDYCALVDVEAAIVDGLVGLGRKAQIEMGCNAVATA